MPRNNKLNLVSGNYHYTKMTQKTTEQNGGIHPFCKDKINHRKLQMLNSIAIKP